MKEGVIHEQRAVVAHDQAPEVSQPGKGAFHFPSPSVAAQGPAILGRRFASVLTMWTDQLDAAPMQSSSQGIAVVGPVGNEPSRPGLGTAPAGPRHALLPKRAFAPRSLPPARRGPSGFPKEYLGRRPPPSTSCPCPAWFCRPRRPLFGGSETSVDETLAPVQWAPPIPLGQKLSPHLEPYLLRLPQAQPSPAGGRADAKVRWQIAPPRASLEDPKDAFEYGTIVFPRTTRTGVLR